MAEIYNGTYTVYCHINKTNGKKYVGITKRPVEKRWLNGRGYNGNSIFRKAINKYGWDNWGLEIPDEKIEILSQADIEAEQNLFSLQLVNA